jgi:hypothetical protein
MYERFFVVVVGLNNEIIRFVFVFFGFDFTLTKSGAGIARPKLLSSYVDDVFASR